MAPCNKDFVFGFMTLAGSTFIHLTYGFIYAAGNLVPYLEVYMAVTPGQLVFYTSTLFACQALSMPLGAILSQYIGFRCSTFISIVLTSGGLFLSSLTVRYGLAAFTFTCSAMFGCGIGAAYSVLYSLTMAWFPKRKSTVVGIIASGLGLAALVFVPIQKAIINPDNLKDLDDPSIKDKIPISFLVIGGITVVLQGIGFFLLRERKPDGTFEKESAQSDEFSNDSAENEVRSYTTLEALQTVDFYIAYFINFFNSISVGLISATAKVYGKENGFDDNFLSTVWMVSAMFNFVGRVLWGLVGDKFSFKFPFGCLQVIWALLWLCYSQVLHVGGLGSKVLYAICTFLLFSCIGGNFVLIPTFVNRVFGPKYMATIFGLLFTALAPSTLLLATVLSQFSVTGKWTIIYGCAAGFALIATKICTQACDCGRSIMLEDPEKEPSETI